jgi:hypothetical protein
MQLASFYLFYCWQTDTGFKKWQKISVGEVCGIRQEMYL